MPDDSLESFRVSVMQDFLPVGIAMVKRIRNGGPTRFVEAFTESNDPIGDLRTEGEPEARNFRDELDRFSPGLGNPVVSVQVDVDENVASINSFEVDDELVNTLNRIEERLDAMQLYLDESTNSTVSNK